MSFPPSRSWYYHCVYIMTIFQSIQQPAPDSTTFFFYSTPPASSPTGLEFVVKQSAAKLPQLTTDMTRAQFRKYKIDWNVLMSCTQYTSQFYSTWNETVQNSISTFSNFFAQPEVELLQSLKSINTKSSTHTVHNVIQNQSKIT